MTCASSTCLPASVAFPSDLSALACAPWRSAKSTPIAAKSLLDIGQAFPATRTCDASRQLDWLPMESAPSTSFAADSPAKMYRMPARAKASRASAVVCGGNSRAFLASYDHATQSWKTLVRSSGADSIACSVIWPRSGSMRNGIAFRLPTLARRTDATGCGLLPTPTAKRYGSTNNGCRADGSTFRTAGTPSLASMASRNLWPTPTQSDANAAGNRNAQASRAHAGVSLTDAVCRRLVPTPTATDWKGASQPGHRRGKLSDPRTAVIPAGGKLNPMWVEWLMGFPIGWSDLARWETQWSLPLLS